MSVKYNIDIGEKLNISEKEVFMTVVGLKQKDM